jgi:hypothetical protein
MTLLRRTIGFYDNNMFVTAWVSQIMLELAKLGIIEFPETQLLASLETLLSFKDRNHPKDIPIYCFWKQIEKNLTYNESIWVEWPTNIANPLSESVIFFRAHLSLNFQENFGDLIANILDSLHLPFLIPYTNKVFEFLPKFLLDAFIIPPDTDDTSVFFGLGNKYLQKGFYFSPIQVRF